MSDNLTKALFNTILGLNHPTQTLYPVQTGVPATGATLTPGVGAWGVLADIIAAAAIVTPFFLTQVQFDTIGAATELFDLEIRNTTRAVVVFQCKPDTVAATANLPPTNPPYPIWCNGNDQIQGRAGAAAATTINVSLLVAVGL
jgi:hypothetical protein